MSSNAGGVSGVAGKAAGIITAVTLLILILWMFQRTVDVFLLLFIAIILSLYLGAVRDSLVKRVNMPPRVAFTASVLLTLLGVVGLFWLLVPAVVGQTRELMSVLPSEITNWEAAFDRFVLSLPGMSGYWKPGQHQILRAVYDQASTYASGAFTRVFSVVGIMIDVFSVFVMSIYLALQPGVYREWLIALFPPRHRDLVRDILHDIASTLRAYIVGQLTTMAVLAILTSLFLWLLNVPYALTFGVFTGMVAIIPFFGSLLSTTLPAAFVLTGPNGGTRALLVLGVGVIVHLIEGNLVSPLVMSKQVELPPVLTIMSVLVVGSLLGPLGLVVALPTLAMVMVVVRRILINRIYEGKGFRKQGRTGQLVLRVPVPDGGVLVPEGGLVDLAAFKARLAPTAPSEAS
ncbi:MAG: AI-2E family transporter [Gemmatimonadaceae bacterium]